MPPKNTAALRFAGAGDRRDRPIPHAFFVGRPIVAAVAFSGGSTSWKAGRQRVSLLRDFNHLGLKVVGIERHRLHMELIHLAPG